MVYQDAYGSVREIKGDGCYLTSIVNAHGIQKSVNYNQLDLNEIYYKATDTKVKMGENVLSVSEKDCYLNSPEEFCRRVLGWRIKQIRKEYDKNYQVKENEIAIYLMRRYDPKSSHADKEGFVYHFVLYTSNGILDPIYGGSVTAANGEIHTMRIIVLDEVSKV